MERQQFIHLVMCCQELVPAPLSRKVALRHKQNGPLTLLDRCYDGFCLDFTTWPVTTFYTYLKQHTLNITKLS